MLRVAVDLAIYTLREDFTREAAISRTRRRLHNGSVNDGAREPRATISTCYIDSLLDFHWHAYGHEGPRIPGDAGRVSQQNCKRRWSIRIPQTAPLEGESPSEKTLIIVGNVEHGNVGFLRENHLIPVPNFL